VIPTPTLTPRARNVLRVYRSGTPSQVGHGRGWFPRAHDLAVELDPVHPERAAAVLAVLSPQLSWPRNVLLARTAYALAGTHASLDDIAGALTGCYKVNARKAAAILVGADPDKVVSGPKVRAFWLSIADPDNPQAVVIDRHAFDIAVGHRTDDDTRQRHLRTNAGRARVIACYLQGARILSRQLARHVTPTEVQAVTWTVWRRSHAIDRRYGDLAVV
jgi:hypothetical protein